MTELKKNDVSIKYVDYAYPDFRSVYEPREVAKRMYYEFDEYSFAPPRQILEIWVDGEKFIPATLFIKEESK